VPAAAAAAVGTPLPMRAVDARWVWTGRVAHQTGKQRQGAHCSTAAAAAAVAVAAVAVGAWCPLQPVAWLLQHMGEPEALSCAAAVGGAVGVGATALPAFDGWHSHVGLVMHGLRLREKDGRRWEEVEVGRQQREAARSGAAAVAAAAAGVVAAGHWSEGARCCCRLPPPAVAAAAYLPPDR